MPKRKATKGTKRSTKKLDSKANEIADITPRQALSMMIEDFEAQVPRLLESVCKKYERESNRALRQLPDKTCIPREIYDMPIKEFIETGGTVDFAMERLREKKRKEFDEEATMKLDGEEKENNAPPTQKSVTAVDFQTPAIRIQPKVTRATTARRKPNQLERVKMMAVSKETGSPVDEKLVMETMMDEMVQSVMKNVLPQISSRTAKAQATKAIEISLTTMKEELRRKAELSVVTPMVTCPDGGGRKRRVRK